MIVVVWEEEVDKRQSNFYILKYPNQTSIVITWEHETFSWNYFISRWELFSESQRMAILSGHNSTESDDKGPMIRIARVMMMIRQDSWRFLNWILFFSIGKGILKEGNYIVPWFLCCPWWIVIIDTRT